MTFAAADADDGAGNSLSYLNLLLIELEAHARLDTDALQPDKHPQVDAQLGRAWSIATWVTCRRCRACFQIILRQ
jgi:hypothetical protein